MVNVQFSAIVKGFDGLADQLPRLIQEARFVLGPPGQTGVSVELSAPGLDASVTDALSALLRDVLARFLSGSKTGAPETNFLYELAGTNDSLFSDEDEPSARANSAQLRVLADQFEAMKATLRLAYLFSLDCASWPTPDRDRRLTETEEKELGRRLAEYA